MKRWCFLALVVLLMAWAAFSGRAEDENERIECSKSATFLAPADGISIRHYAADREVQMLHLALDVTPDFKNRAVAGRAALDFLVSAKPVREIKFDAVDLDVHSVTSSRNLQAWQVTHDKLIVTFAEPLPPQQQAQVVVTYSAEPTEGLYFRTPDMGYREGDTHLFSQGEEIEARHWYPCLDSPNQRFTSEITCRVAPGMTVISNGRLLSQETDPASGLTAFHWSQEKPHANYLISLVAGYFKKVEDACGDIPLSFYTPPSEFDEATNSFRDTKDIMQFFQQEIGVPFPWAKYSQVCVNDFVAGGMENTSATTLTDYTLFTGATENLRSSEGLVAHEMAHQWFGDLVTCKDWSHVWLNEGFATYYASLYDGHKHGPDAFKYGIYERVRELTGIFNETNSIVRRNYGEPGEMFGYLVYPKASMVLHMLRAQLGADLYRRCVQTYLERHQLGSVVTEDFRAVIEELSGRSFDQFFDQWLYHGHFPELDVNYAWDESAKLAKLSLQQVQELSPNVLLFDFPLTIRFTSATGSTNCEIQVTKRAEDFYFPLPSAPETVRIDPEQSLLAKIKFTPSRPMLLAQLANSHDVLGRLIAIEQLAGKREREAINQLRQCLNHDEFYGVRIEAANALRATHTDEALAALLASTNQPDARVRLAVMQGLGGFYDDQAYTAARLALPREQNPEIVSTLLGGLGGYAKPEVRAALLGALGSDSYRNELAVAAIGAMRLQDDPSYVAPLQQDLTARESSYTSRGFAQGLEALGYLARNQEKKEDICKFLLAWLDSKKRIVKMAAINSLATLGDPQALAAIQKFATAGKTTPERTAAERAVAELRAARKPVDDFKNLRQEVLELQKTNRDLRRELDELKRKVETQTLQPAAMPAKSKPPVKSPKGN